MRALTRAMRAALAVVLSVLPLGAINQAYAAVPVSIVELTDQPAPGLPAGILFDGPFYQFLGSGSTEASRPL